MSDLRIYILVRKDLDMPAGKLAAQAGHAALHTFLKAPEELQHAYLNGEHAYKITLGLKNKNALDRAAFECENAGLPTVRVVDKGFTVFDKPTFTCVGVGPCRREDLPPFVAKQQLLS